MAKALGLSIIEVLVACGILALVCTVSVSTSRLLRLHQQQLQEYKTERTNCLNRYELQEADRTSVLTKNININTLQTKMLSLEYLQAH